MFRFVFSGCLALAACLVVLLGLTQGSAKAHTITVTDTLGRQVEVPAQAQRILLGFYFEDFYAIGGPEAYDRVAAISKAAWHDWRNSQWKVYLAANPKIADLIDVGEVDAGTFSLETAVAARPDVAIIAAWQFHAMGPVVGKLEAAGIPVVVADYNAQTVEKHTISTLMIGQILGAEDRAQELADNYAAAVADVEARVKKAGGDPERVYVELGNKGADELGNTYTDHMWGGVIGLAGGQNIALGQVGKWAPLNPEYVLASNPQAIFVAGSYWVSRDKALLMGFGVTEDQTQARLQPFADRPGWAELEAVKEGKVYALYHGGARTLYDYTFLQYIAKALYPEAFQDVDPQANHRAFYERYLPVAAEGVFMTRLSR
ncbi:ABC transporter substrate-binding protein [Rhodovibrionaceae bacterium A322]